MEEQQRLQDLYDAGYVPAYQNASEENLANGYYCRFCEMSWYNCLCSHDDDEG